MRKLTHQEIVSRQGKRIRERRIPIAVVLDDIRSLHNVGSIFRTSDGIGIEKIWLCGITGYPPHPRISKIAIGAETQVPWEYREDSSSVIKGLKKQGYQIVLLEQTDAAIDYHDFVPHDPTCLVVGNEIGGISEKLVSLADASVHIEMRGSKNSLNAAVAFGIVAYHLSRHLKDKRIV